MKHHVRSFLILLVIAGTMMLSACQKPVEVNLNDFVEITASGNDTLGLCSAEFDHRALLRSVDGKLKDDQVYEAKKILKSVSLVPPWVSNCRNGQKLDFDWDISESDVQKLLEECKLAVTYSNVSYTVSGLTELKEADIFDDLQIELKGYENYGQLDMSAYGKYPGLVYKADKSLGLSNGEMVRIRAELAYSMSGSYKSVEEYLASIGVKPVALDKIVKIEGLAALKDYSPFSSINFAFQGITGKGSADIYTDWSDEFYPNWYYTVDYNGQLPGYLSNGDIITVRVTDRSGNDITIYAAHDFGLRVTETVKEYKVEGLLLPGGIDTRSIGDDEFFAYRNEQGIYVDKYGERINLGGIRIVVRDWWSAGRKNPDDRTDFEKALYSYWDNMQMRYNFTIERWAMDDWGNCVDSFIDYACLPDDGNYYMFTLRDDPLVTTAVANGLMYDLSSLYSLDFSEPKFTANRVHEKYSKGQQIYAMHAGSPQPTTGVFFNKEILREAGIDPEEIYDLQKNGGWTWDRFENYCEQIESRTGYKALSCEATGVLPAIVHSNDGVLVGKEDNGRYYWDVDNERTRDALYWASKLFGRYNIDKPQDAAWDYYRDVFIHGQTAFLIEDEYVSGLLLLDGMPIDYGFVMFPEGPRGISKNVWNDYLQVIPSNYSKYKAGQIAFAWNLFTDPVPGWEDFDQQLDEALSYGHYDERTKKETIPMMMSHEHGTIAYHTVIPDLDAGEFLSKIDGKNDISVLVDDIRAKWITLIDKENARINAN